MERAEPADTEVRQQQAGSLRGNAVRVHEGVVLQGGGPETYSESSPGRQVEQERDTEGGQVLGECHVL